MKTIIDEFMTVAAKKILARTNAPVTVIVQNVRLDLKVLPVQEDRKALWDQEDLPEQQDRKVRLAHGVCPECRVR